MLVRGGEVARSGGDGSSKGSRPATRRLHGAGTGSYTNEARARDMAAHFFCLAECNLLASTNVLLRHRSPGPVWGGLAGAKCVAATRCVLALFSAATLAAGVVGDRGASTRPP